MLDHYYAVIMAGGGGTRLWPLSRRSRPKQMLALVDERSLFQTAVQRLAGLFPPERILVVTVQEQADDLRAQAPEIPSQNYLIEPMPRGTASVVGLAALALSQRDQEAVMAILTADHYIGSETRFHQLLHAAHDAASDGYLVTLGIEPTFPATGYGYVQRGEQVGTYGGLDVFHALRFREKPDAAAAQQMLASGDHAWNSGMFVWRTQDILAEFERQMPELAAQLAEIRRAWDGPEQQAVVGRVWPQIRTQTIDYGIMEGAQRVATIPAAGLEWSDVGSWDSLFDVLPADSQGNIVMGGQHIALDSQRSLVYTGDRPRLVVTIGLDDLIVVDTGDVLLVCPTDQAQRVREVVDRLKKDGPAYL
jgi:mannose-1-phosphate guanylyltransferase